jgi:hypothetical protein
MEEDLKSKCTQLSGTYTFWYHSPENNDYSISSYIELLEFNTLEEWWVLDKFIRRDMIENGMFFIMKAGCLPVWEDPSNINGGCVSWKVDRKISYKTWVDTVGHFIMNYLCNMSSKVNGVCISPKKNSSIIKVWFNEQINVDDLKFNDSFILVEDKIIYKSHLQNIDKDKQKRQSAPEGGHRNYNQHHNNNSNRSYNGHNIHKTKYYDDEYNDEY